MNQDGDHGMKLRLATAGDAPRLKALMDAAIAELLKPYLPPQGVRASFDIMGLDTQLIADGCYFAVESAGEIVGCGGWSRRDRMHTGSGDHADDARLLDPATEPARVRAMFVRADWTRRGLGRRILEECEAAADREGFTELVLNATLPGLPLYSAYGFEPTEEIVVTLPDGVEIECVAMRKTIERRPSDGNRPRGG